MNLLQISKDLELIQLTDIDLDHRVVSGVYICDLLSWVMAHAKKDYAWITVQTHLNIIAVATLLEIGCIIVPEDIDVEEETLKKANEEGIPVLKSSLSAFDIAKRLYELGIGK